jgi:hypothetical protein
MKLNKLMLALFAIAASAIIFTACKDEFTEEDFLNMQAELARELAATQQQYELEKLETQREVQEYLLRLQNQLSNDREDEIALRNLEALRKSGLITNYSVRVQSDDEPVAGATLTAVTSSSSNGARQVVTTDANGVAVFTDLVWGGNIITIEATGYLTVEIVVTFSAPAGTFTQVGNIIYPVGRNEASEFELFSNDVGAEKTATVKGRVTIETDLTNDTPEIPQDLTIKLRLTGAAANTNSSGVTINKYIFASNAIGTGVVNNTTGEYTITIPAKASGLAYAIDLPEFELNQTVAINRLSSETENNPRLATIATSYGPTLTNSGTVTVPSAKAVFPSAPAAGDGLAGAIISVVPRSFNPGNINFTSGGEVQQDNIVLKINSRGAYTAIPTVAVIGGGFTTQAAYTAVVQGWVTGITITNAGTGLPPNTAGNINIIAQDATNADLGTVVSIPYTSTAGGTLPSAIMVPLNVSGPNQRFNFPTSIVKVRVEVPGATGAVVAANYTGELTGLNQTTTGANYVSAPSFTLSGGGTSATQASVSVAAMLFSYNWTVSNANNSAPYSVVPGITVEYADTYTTNAGPAISKNNTLNNHVLTFNDGVVSNSAGLTIASRLVVSNGQIVQQGPGEFFRTTSFTVPNVIITKTVPQQASRRVDIAADGTIAGLLAFNAGAGDHDGTGYAANTLTVSIEPAFAGAPGSGAGITLTNFNTAGQWSGTTNFSLANPGSGYKQNVNRATQAFSGGSALTAKPGDILVRNIEYGTGRRNVQVQ